MVQSLNDVIFYGQLQRSLDDSIKPIEVAQKATVLSVSFEPLFGKCMYSIPTEVILHNFSLTKPFHLIKQYRSSQRYSQLRANCE